jgi:hypothetical protein
MKQIFYISIGMRNKLEKKVFCIVFKNATDINGKPHIVGFKYFHIILFVIADIKLIDKIKKKITEIFLHFKTTLFSPIQLPNFLQQ